MFLILWFRDSPPVVNLSPASNYASNCNILCLLESRSLTLSIDENQNLKICCFSKCGIFITHFKSVIFK